MQALWWLWLGKAAFASSDVHAPQPRPAQLKAWGCPVNHPCAAARRRSAARCPQTQPSSGWQPLSTDGHEHQHHNALAYLSTTAKPWLIRECAEAVRPEHWCICRQAARLKERISATASNPALSPLSAPSGGSPLYPMGGTPFLTPRSSMSPSTSVLTPRGSLSSPRSLMGTPRAMGSPRGLSMTPRGRPPPGVSPLSRMQSAPRQEAEALEYRAPQSPTTPQAASRGQQGEPGVQHQGTSRLQSHRGEQARPVYKQGDYGSPGQQQQQERRAAPLALHVDARAFVGSEASPPVLPAQRSPVPLLPLDRLKQMQL